MSVFLKNGYWWYEFTACGTHICNSSHSTDEEVARLIEAEHRKSVERGTGSGSAAQVIGTKPKPRWTEVLTKSAQAEEEPPMPTPDMGLV